MASHSSTFTWKIPWTKEPGRLQSRGVERIRQDWVHRHIATVFNVLQALSWLISMKILIIHGNGFYVYLQIKKMKHKKVQCSWRSLNLVISAYKTGPPNRQPLPWNRCNLWDWLTDNWFQALLSKKPLTILGPKSVLHLD